MDMKVELYSERLGRTLTFTKPGGCYVHVDLNDGVHEAPVPICQGGKLTGAYIGDVRYDIRVLESIAERWLAEYEKNQDG